MSFISKLFTKSGSKNSQLTEAVRAVMQDDSLETRQTLCSVFQRSTLIVPTVRDGNVALPMLLKDPEGHLALPVFTDLEAFSRALREWGSSESRYNSVQGSDLFTFALQHSVDTIVINLTDARGVEITRREMTMLAEHGTVIENGEGFSTPMVIDQNAKRQIKAASKELSGQFIDSLHKGMERHPQISAGYLAEVAWGEGEPHPIVGIHFTSMPDERTIRKIIEALSKAVHPALAEGEYVDFVIMQYDETSRNLQDSGLLIYQR